MFDCLKPAIDDDRSLSRAECSGLQPKVIICIERLFNGGRYSKQSLLFHYFFFKGKNTPKLLHKIGAPCKRKPPHGSLAFEWNFFLTRWLVRFYDQKSAFHAD